MSDIFEIRGVNAVLKVGDKEYKFADPCFPDKVKLQKEMRELSKQKESLEYEDYLMKMFEINKRMIKMYLPDMSMNDLNRLGEFSINALISKILALTENSFGATVEKVEAEVKKESAASL